jgi:hypothetical protein
MNEREEAAVHTTLIDYDYAIVRVVPRVHLETFVPVGVVLHARTTQFLQARFAPDWSLLRALSPQLDTMLLQRVLDAYGRVCAGGTQSAPVGILPPSERFHWLTAPRSAVLQTSSVRPGRCHDAVVALEELFKQYVLETNSGTESKLEQGGLRCPQK